MGVREHARRTAVWSVGKVTSWDRTKCLPVPHLIEQAPRDRALRPATGAVRVGAHPERVLEILRRLGDDLALHGRVVLAKILRVGGIAETRDIGLNAELDALVVPGPPQRSVCLRRLGGQVEYEGAAQA